MAEQTDEQAKKSGTKDAVRNPEKAKPAEIGGPKGLEPTRYNDWEKAGRCIDF